MEDVSPKVVLFLEMYVKILYRKSSRVEGQAKASNG